MTNKFISIILSLMLLISVMPVADAFASSAVTVYYEEDFNDFTTKSFNADASATTTYNVTDNSGTRLSVGKNLKTDIVNMKGYDGENTDVLKITLSDGAAVGTEDARIIFPGLAEALANTTTGAVIYDFKMYIPAKVNGTQVDLDQFIMAPIYKNGEYYAIGKSTSGTDNRRYAGTISYGRWYKFTYVYFESDDSILLYRNDELVVKGHSSTNCYRVKYEKSDTGYIQVTRKRDVANEHIIFDDISIRHIASVSSADSAPQCITKVSSSYAGRKAVPVSDSPVIKFSEMVEDAIINDVATVSDCNIIMTDSSGNPVDKTYSVSSDNKSITVNPVYDMEPDSTYTIKLTGLKDMYEVTIPDYTLTFTTAPIPDIEVSEPQFKLDDISDSAAYTQTATELADGDVGVSFTIENTTNDKTKNAIAFLIIRDENGTLSGLQFKNMELAPNEEQTIDMRMHVVKANTKSVEFYVWDSFTDRNALSPSYTISADGINNSKDE